VVGSGGECGVESEVEGRVEGGVEEAGTDLSTRAGRLLIYRY
jgi:hypothetical protein